MPNFSRVSNPYVRTAFDGSLFVQMHHISAVYVRMMLLLSFKTKILFQTLNDVAR